MIIDNKLKSKYRIKQIGDDYYIQHKEFFGWSYNTTYKLNDFQGFLILFFLAFDGLFIISIIIALCKMEYNQMILFSFISSIVTFSIFTIYNLTSKSISIKCYSIKSAENKVDSMVESELKNLEEKQIKKAKNKEVKYHYFYTQKQLRAEKLKQIK